MTNSSFEDEGLRQAAKKLTYDQLVKMTAVAINVGDTMAAQILADEAKERLKKGEHKKKEQESEKKETETEAM